LLRDRPALFRHHDFRWQGPKLDETSIPPTDPRWLHVTINDLSRNALNDVGILATTLRNRFACEPPSGDRQRTRDALGITNERLALFPSRAIPRKNVAGAIHDAEALGATLWLLGPSEDGYEEELERLVASSPVTIVRGPTPAMTIHDAYAACDIALQPSTWEGFGNATIESVIHRKPLVVHHYPVLDEIMSYGFHFFHTDHLELAQAFLESPDQAMLDENLRIAQSAFSLSDLGAVLDDVVAVALRDPGE
jgi:glycosyltransferase involved in cell wall biosynthesis